MNERRKESLLKEAVPDKLDFLKEIIFVKVWTLSRSLRNTK